ncbi:DDE-type integrase/transposase/recombinase [Mucilaginibacter lappiensis]|uniref:IS1 family transposase n=1 Tax=Mucilaginibacter lappiensis TaxID=354630 RepID=A0A841J6I8_9SPHI|nr:DDE-type integrase/transposase/recombinase [Mucilaginibacter lappiensis]MBB6126384.1 IS1 family transposase [Mucilaginibacter lappiensis]
MNKLPTDKRVQIINCLVEGMSLRATSRLVDVSINTVTKLLVDTGKACQNFHDETVHSLTSERVQCDEIWSFVGMKESHVPQEKKGSGIGDAWTWTAIDADSKLVLSYYVGNRDAQSAWEFMSDVKSRLNNRVQLTTDGLRSYLDAVRDTFGKEVDFAQIKKIYASDNPKGAKRYNQRVEARYSPGDFVSAEIVRVIGNPEVKHVSTSYVERQNLTMRMHMRRFTRLTNGFSKKIENHCYAIALHFVYYNFCKIHKTLRVTPAMQAGLTKDVMTIEDIVKLTD